MLILLALIIVIKHFSSTEVHKTAAVIANQEFSPNYPTTVIWWETAPENIHHFTKEYKGLVVTLSLNYTNENETLTREFVYDQTVIYVKHVEEFSLILKMVKPSLEPIQLILVLIEVNESRITNLIQVAWKNEVAQIIIVTTNKKKDINLYTFIPYTPGDCGNITPVEVPINAPSFSIRKFINFNKCPLTLSAHTSMPYIKVIKENDKIILSGFESDVINLIVERLNASLVVISNEGQERDNIANDSLKVGFSDLISKDADVMLPAVFVNEKRYSVALTTYTYNDLTIVWIAPKQRVIYAWANLILPFISRITPLIILTFISFIAVVKLIIRFGRYHEFKEKTVIFQSFTILLGLQTKFETKCWLNNTVHVLWVWYCFLIRIAYQGDLINGLHKVILEPPIRTVNDGLQNLDKVVASAAIQELYKNTSLEEQFNVLAKPSDSEVYLKKIVDEARILLAEDFVSVKSHGYSEMVQFLEESVIRFPACLFVRARWPGVDEFRRKIMEFHQHGFFGYYYYQNKARHYRRYERNHGLHIKEQNTEPLTIVSLSSLFYGLLMAYFICFIVFCMEIIWFKTKATRENPIVKKQNISVTFIEG
ncbi:uncharacterized protein LOC123708337 [Pieris brassicae]|uniref:uncharacterized protein LOC123708337 n=1 Tax=Pieris brassicae TaxID=7116 RepID=UPI001E6626B7|nr:uncharacterized protein LOC123708337 [Pieris brassicae]